MFFKRMKRQTGQSIREFNSVFDRGHSRLLKIDCKLPEVARSWAYLSSLGLTNSEELSLLASAGNDYNTAKLQKAAILHEKSLRFLKGEGKGPKTAFLTGAESEDGIQEPDGEDADGADEILAEEAAVEIHEAFVAQESAKARYRDVIKARGIDPESLKNSKQGEELSRQQLDDKLAQAKLKSYCAGCGRRGHWHKDAECPLNKPGGVPAKPKPSQDHQVHATTATSSRSVVLSRLLTWSGILGVVVFLQSLTRLAVYKSVMGQKWLESYLKLAKGDWRRRPVFGLPR